MTKRIYNKINRILLGVLPKKKWIVFESVPDLSDNTKAVFDEMVRRKLNQKYLFIMKVVWQQLIRKICLIFPVLKKLFVLTCPNPLWAWGLAYGLAFVGWGLLNGLAFVGWGLAKELADVVAFVK